MRNISEQELKDILDKHGKWLRKEPDGERANLSFADLRFADLSFADLRFADLRSANLSYADLRSTNLSYANLSSADLRFADLRYADLFIFQAQRHQAIYTFDGALRIGCIFMPITEWLLGFKEIGKKEGYIDAEIEMYGNFIKMCAKHFEKNNA